MLICRWRIRRRGKSGIVAARVQTLRDVQDWLACTSDFTTKPNFVAYSTTATFGLEGVTDEIDAAMGGDP